MKNRISSFCMHFYVFHINLCCLASFFDVQLGSIVHWRTSEGPTLTTAVVKVKKFHY